MSLVPPVLAGDRLALARLLTQLENETPEGLQDLSALYGHTGQAHRVGITGAPGTGKSALVNRLVQELRSKTDSPQIAIVAVDPSSPFSGGAILGDRIRMRDLSGDPGVFIRSMANRGALGGLARTSSNLVAALDAAGFGIVFIETVGSGQAEVDIAGAAHTVVVLDAPGMGDTIQALKAGILEIADLIVVNKSDLPGAKTTLAALRATLELGPAARNKDRESNWTPPLLLTSATTGEGIPELASAIGEHRRFLEHSGEWLVRERERVDQEVGRLLRERLAESFLKAQPDGFYEEALRKVVAREASPGAVVEQLIEGAVGAG
jgi:LAO/AO transport system kinase